MLEFMSLFAVYPLIFFLKKLYQILNLTISPFRWTGATSVPTTASFASLFITVVL